MQESRESRIAPAPMSTWVVDDRPARTAAKPAEGRKRVPYRLPGDVQTDVRRVWAGTAAQRERAINSLTKAAEAYDRHRYEEALRLVRPVVDGAPGVAAVRELAGLAAYRSQRWSIANANLREHYKLTGSPDHLPAVMDCERAGKRFRAIEKTFAEIIASQPTADVLSEARIVMAETLADQHRYDEAIDLLVRAGAAKSLRNPAYRHVRMWYVLGDISDRAGDAVTAREMFARVVIADPEAYDASQRLDELGTPTPRKNRKRKKTPVSKKKLV